MWVAFHALQQFATGSPLCALLPYRYKRSTTPAVIKHGFGRQTQAIEWLNQEHITVTIFDQALFAVAKLS